MLRRGERVWVNSDIGVPIGALVKVTDTGQRLLVDDEGKECTLSRELEASLRVMHPTSVEGVDDMIRLGDLNDAGLLRNLMIRHKLGIIYTYTGSVLLAVNPYQELPIYTNDQVRMYQGRKLGEMPPHIFAIADSCHFNMRRYQKDQCCIISGESGAGKTESTKLILQYLSAVSGQHSWIEQQILESNPILEAFGNAKTIRNDNSSRFGKYLEIFFNKDGVIEGACVEQYLLEKSRVCHQAVGERNYHVFYCMLVGMTAEQKESLHLGDATEYRFLTQGDCIVCEGRSDAKDFDRIRSALRILTFTETQSQEIFKLLAAILHMGNVDFTASTNINNMDSSSVSKSEHFNLAVAHLEVQSAALADSLTCRSFLANRESVTKPLSSEQASDCRDAFVKAIYNKLFIWIVGRINSVIQKTTKKTSRQHNHQSIGLLDIFGFENFKTNSFEQLCINFANEQLQQYFVHHIFKQEQEEYRKEDIEWNSVTFGDNQLTLDLLAGKPCNLLALIDEESNFPKGTDVTMLNKINMQHCKNNLYIPSKNEHDRDFGIHHFVGVVYYDSNGFLEKNRDALSSDIIKMINTSTNKLLHQMFKTELSTNQAKNPGNSKITITPKNSMKIKKDGRKQVPTLSSQFRQSLDSLMKTLSVCQPFFIRCFKPNNDKKSKCFDRELCMRQLRYSGMVDTIRIRKLGYPIRHKFKDFLQRYRVLLRTAACDPKTERVAACCEAICKAVITGEDSWILGKTKIFLKDAHDAFLEREREQELNKKALIIQRVMIVLHDRKCFLNKRKAALVLQRRWRSYREMIKLRKLLLGFQRLGSRIRSRQLQVQYKKKRDAALVIQSQVRGCLARNDLKKKREAVILLQACTRGVLARRRVLKMKTDEIHRQLEEVLDQSQQAAKEPEPMSEQEVVTSTFQPTAPAVRQGRASVGFEVLEEECDVPEMVEETPAETSASEWEPETPAADTPPPSHWEEYDEEDENDEFSFVKFSSLHFQGSATHTHITQRLRQPLLRHEDEGDTLACLTVWWIILRFMRDLPEPKRTKLEQTSPTSSPRIRTLVQRQGRRLSNLVGLDQKILRKNKRKFGGGNRRASTIPEEPEDLMAEEDILIGEGPTLDRPLSSLEQLHIIVGYALSRQHIRDEIYCQICKQLVKNRSQSSCLRGWILLSVCLGIFPPTDLLMKHLESFLHRGPSGYGAYCTERLHRTVANGQREEPPCWIELQATKSKKPMDVSVILMDDQSFSLPMDSAITSAEVCQVIAQRINLKDTSGFSLYISLYDKLWSLGSSSKHVMDAISQCEQEVRRREDKEEQHALWKLYFRKELFTPWHDCSVDPVSTDLIYRQVIRALKSGEYTCEKEDEYVQLVAKHYFVQFGFSNNTENLQTVVKECIPTSLIETKSQTKWVQLISSAHLQNTQTSNKMTTESVKAEMVDFALQKWPIYFSKFYEVTMTSGPPLPKSRFIVAVNGSGVLLMDGSDKKLMELPYIEVTGALMTNGQIVSLSTVKGEFVLKCVDARDMATMIQTNLEGLRERSVYAVALQDVIKPDDPSFLVFRRNDLLKMEKDRDNSPDCIWSTATNDRTGNSGAIYMDMVQFLPTLDKPNDDILHLLHPHNGARRKSLTPLGSTQREEAVAPISLKEFSFENFRQPGKEGSRHGQSKLADRERLWAFSREPLKQPLLRSVVDNSDLSHLAVSAFIAILKYMGDYPIKHNCHFIVLTDQIFGPALQYEALQNEIYCQIMRQLTTNKNRLSMQHGWQLLWLCTGLFAPSQTLLRHAQRFLESRSRDPMAVDCLQRLQGMLRVEARKLPPHQVEVEAIQKNSAQIFHKVHFPNDTNDVFEVTSTTRIRDLCQSIASKLKLSSADGYALFMKTPNKVTSLEDQEYFFDSLRQTADLPKKSKKIKEGTPSTMPYLVIFMRKLWFNVIPGRDLTADLTFHFPQELPKYLRGYHSCGREEMISLAGLLFRIQTSSDRSQFVMIPKMLKDLVPADQMNVMSPDEWKKHIISSYNKQTGVTVEEAKVAFLQKISSWPTFGCVFFEAKQTSEPRYPNTIRIAISKQGVTLIDPKTKELLIKHPFSRITNWHSSKTYFQMTIGSLVRDYTLFFETSLGHKMDDLLRSYVSMYERERLTVLPRKQLFS